MATQAPHEVEPRLDRGAEMGRARDGIALVQVVGTHAHHQLPMQQVAHHRHAVVHTLEQHRLRSQGNARVGEAAAGAHHFGGAFVRVREVDAQPERMVLVQHLDKGRGDALGHHDGHHGADAYELDVGDAAQFTEQPVQFVVRQGQRVAARKQHVADLRRVADVLQAQAQASPIGLQFALPHDPRASAVAAVGRAVVMDQEEHAVRIAVHDARHRCVLVLAQRVVRFARCAQEFLVHGHHRPAQGLLGIRGIEQAHVVRRDAQRQQIAALAQGSPFRIRQLEDRFQLRQRADTVPHLPVPVVPILGGDVGEVLSAEMSREGPLAGRRFSRK